MGHYYSEVMGDERDDELRHELDRLKQLKLDLRELRSNVPRDFSSYQSSGQINYIGFHYQSMMQAINSRILELSMTLGLVND